MKLDPRYAFLTAEPGPRLITEALKLHGIAEGAGKLNNKTIIGWAGEVAKADPTAYNRWAGQWYAEDSIAWCGLFVAICAVRSAEGRKERMPPAKYLSAVSWANWGKPVPKTGAMLGDVLVFTRQGGGHVGLYVGEDADCFHVLGGNQSDPSGGAVTISRISKLRLHSVRRPPYLAQPANVRKIKIAASGPVSVNEA